MSAPKLQAVQATPVSVDSSALAPAGEAHVTAVSTEQPADDKQHSDFLWNVQKYTSDYVRFADTKAAAVLVFCSSLIGVMYTSKHPARLLTVPLASWSAGDWLLVGALLSLMAALVCVACTIVPRLQSRQARGFIYWNSVLEQGTADSYWHRLSELTGRQLAEHLAHHVYDVAEISSAKYRWVNRALRWAAFGGTLAVVVMVAT